MLPAELFANTNDPVELHDARIQTAVTNENEIVLKLHGDDNGGLRKIEIRYDRTGLAVPEIPNDLLQNNPDCDLMCHEFIAQKNCLEHHMLFASGAEIMIQFRNIVANFIPDRDITM